jgi:hypothetical protein
MLRWKRCRYIAMSLAATGTTSYTLEQVGKVNTIKLLSLRGFLFATQHEIATR